MRLRRRGGTSGLLLLLLDRFEKDDPGRQGVMIYACQLATRMAFSEKLGGHWCADGVILFELRSMALYQNRRNNQCTSLESLKHSQAVIDHMSREVLESPR